MKKNLSISILLPHCDDELFVLPFIEKKISEGYIVNVFFLIEASVVRQKESEKLLSKYSLVNVFHFGTIHKIPDGKISEHQEIVFSLLKSDEKIISASSIITPAFEGGHVDHDEIFLIGHQLLRNLNKTHLCFSTYNSYKTPFVRVSKIYKGIMDGEFEQVNFSLLDGMRYLFQCFYFKSQFIILAILFPGLIRTFLFKRKIELLRVTSFDSKATHPGKIFYQNDLKKKMKAFLMVQ